MYLTISRAGLINTAANVKRPFRCYLPGRCSTRRRATRVIKLCPAGCEQMNWQAMVKLIPRTDAAAISNIRKPTVGSAAMLRPDRPPGDAQRRMPSSDRPGDKPVCCRCQPRPLLRLTDLMRLNRCFPRYRRSPEPAQQRGASARLTLTLTVGSVQSQSDDVSRWRPGAMATFQW